MIEATVEECEEVEEGKEEMKSTECPANKKNRVMTDADVLANCVGIILSGHETTSTTLSFASYLLALHPDIQVKLQSEIDMYFDDNPVSLLTFLCASLVPRPLPVFNVTRRKMGGPGIRSHVTLCHDDVMTSGQKVTLKSQPLEALR